mgnify:CR=1 FL=1
MDIKKNFNKEDINATFIKNNKPDIFDNKIKDNELDLVICTQSIHHVTFPNMEYKNVLNNIINTLNKKIKKNGYIFKRKMIYMQLY